jgi:hypothetical protein
MRANAHNRYAQRAGRWLGHICRHLLRCEKQLAAWLVNVGVTVGASKFLIWLVRFAVVAAIMSLSLVFALFLAVLVLAARVLANADPSIDRDQPEWRDGLLGFGLYDRKGFRIDPHDSGDNQ